MTEAEQEHRAALVLLLRSHGIRDLRVLNAFERVPRLLFIDGTLAARAATDSPLPLPCGQVMERPSLAAKMIEQLAVEPQHHVLEIGAGSGWLTSVLAGLSARVTAVERYRELCAAATRRFQNLGLSNIRLRQGDGAENREGPFDRVLVSASVEDIPGYLTAQLKEGGKIIVALGSAKAPQQLTCFIKTGQELRQESSSAVRMTPIETGMALAL